MKSDMDYLLIYTEDRSRNLSVKNEIKILDGEMIMMRILAMLVILCVLFCTGCASKHLGYDAGIAAYKRGDYKVALYDFEPRAMAGDPVAQFCLGFMYTHGQGVGKDLQAARKWYGMAAKQGHPPAQNNLLVRQIRFLEERERSWEKLEVLRRSLENILNMQEQIEKDVADRMNTVSANIKVLKTETKTIKAEVIESVQWIAEHGNPIAQHNLGVMYSSGYEVPRDLKMAAAWYQKAAEQGYDRSQNALGLMYLEGEAVRKNVKEAAKLFKMAAAQGYAPAQNELGLMYFEGRGMEKNPKEAVKLFKMAAAQGHSNAQYNLAVIYVEKNPKEASEWFKGAAKQSNPFAQHQLALMYYEGNGVPKNSERTFRLLLESAQQGYGIAQVDFGRSIEKHDTEEAYYWYSLAIKSLDKTRGGNRIAEIVSAHERIGKMLTEQQRNDIQKQVDNWKPKHLTSAGTGFYINEKHILTNEHVVSECDELRVPYRPVVVNHKNSEVDLALLFDPRGKENTATFRSEPIVSGEDVVVFGYPLIGVLSYRGNLTVGTISGLLGPIDARHPDSDDLFQYTAPIQGGNSGGPVLDNVGNVVGVVVSGLNPSFIRNQNVNFAIKFDAVKDFLQKNNITDYASTENLGKPIAREEIHKKARSWTVPVLCFKNIGEAPLPLVEIGIDELNR